MLYLQTLGIQVVNPLTDVQLEYDEAANGIRVVVEVASIQGPQVSKKVSTEQPSAVVPVEATVPTGEEGAVGTTIPFQDITNDSMLALVAQGANLAYTTNRNSTVFIDTLNTSPTDGEGSDG